MVSFAHIPQSVCSGIAKIQLVVQGLHRGRRSLTLASVLCSAAVSRGEGASLRSPAALLMALPASLARSLGFFSRLMSAGAQHTCSHKPSQHASWKHSKHLLVVSTPLFKVSIDNSCNFFKALRMQNKCLQQHQAQSHP